MKDYSKTGRLLIWVGLLLGGSNAYAAQQFWVSLGSFGEQSGAESLRDKAASSFSQLSIVSADSPVGLVYRVVDGPVSTRARADSMLQQARIGGFSDAWILITEDSLMTLDDLSGSDQTTAALVDADPLLSDVNDSGSYRPEYASSGTALDGYRSDYADESNSDNTDDYSSLPLEKQQPVESAPAGYGLPERYSADENTSDDNDEYVNLPLGKQELVESAPAGYGLHQLRRAGGALPSGPAAESRLRALDALGSKSD